MIEEQNFITVSQLGNYIKNIFDNEEMLHNISIFGEISAYKLYRGDTAYFTIKDEEANIDCVMFGANKLDFQPQIGESVIVKGSPNYYVKGGKLNFNVKNMIAYGKGALYLKFLQLKEKLEKEGLFKEEYKKVVPNNAINIGVATSLQGAVLQDIKNVSYRRNAGVNLFVYGCRVQGLKADETIIEAIKELDKLNLDVIIVARGGGSSEDLDCFNSEKLARVVFDCKTPIVSAVGHETDFTIIDFVADKRAPTPSAAAEIVVANVTEQVQLLTKLLNRLYISLNREIMQKKRECEINLQKNYVYLVNYIQSVKQKLLINLNKLERYENEFLININNKYKLLCQALEKSNPLIIMSRGFATIEDISGKKINSINQVQKGQQISINLIDGQIQALINEIDKEKKYEF